MVFQTKFTQDL